MAINQNRSDIHLSICWPACELKSRRENYAIDISPYLYFAAFVMAYLRFWLFFFSLPVKMISATSLFSRSREDECGQRKM